RVAEGGRAVGRVEPAADSIRGRGCAPGGHSGNRETRRGRRPRPEGGPMDPDFWRQRWRDNKIGFHQERVLPLLEKHWPSLGLATGSRVFVPLCGKSLDMAWLAARGHRVLGVELSPIAVEQFFDENALVPD